MWKIVFILTLGIFFNLFAYSQSYLVVKTWGEASYDGATIEKGKVIDLNKSIRFAEKNNKLLLADKSGKLFWSEAPAGVDFQVDKTLIEIEQNLTRGFMKKNLGVRDFKTYFGNEKFTLVGDQVSVPVNLDYFPLNDAHFLVFHYNLEGQTVSKKIGFNNQKLILSKQDLLNINNKTLETSLISDLEVYEYFPNSGQSNLISTIDLQFVSPDEIINEASLITNYIDSESDNLNTIIDSYLNNAYGKFDNFQKGTIKSKIKQ